MLTIINNILSFDYQINTQINYLDPVTIPDFTQMPKFAQQVEVCLKDVDNNLLRPKQLLQMNPGMYNYTVPA